MTTDGYMYKYKTNGVLAGPWSNSSVAPDKIPPEDHM